MARIPRTLPIVLVLSAGCRAPEPTAAPVAIVSAAPPSTAAPASACAVALAKALTRAQGETHLEVFLPPLTSPADTRLGRALRHVFSALQPAQSERFSVELVEASDPNYVARARALGLPERKPPEGSGYRALYVEYLGSSTQVPMLADDAAIVPYVVLSELHQFQAKAEGRRIRVGLVGASAGNPLEQPLIASASPADTPPSLFSVLTQAFPEFEWVPVDLGEGERAVDASLPGVLVMPLNGGFSAPELARLDEFLMLGGKTLAVFSSAAKLGWTSDGATATLESTALNAFLAAYGIRVNEDLVLDFGASFSVELPEGLSHPTGYFPGLPIVTKGAGPLDRPWLDHDSRSFLWLDQVALPFASSLTLRAPDSAVATAPLAITSPWTALVTQREGLVPLGIFEEPRPPGSALAGGAIVAAAAEGLLPSALCGPEATGCARAATPSEVVVVASRLFPTNPFLSIQTPAASSLGAPSSNPAMALLAEAYAKQVGTQAIMAIKNTAEWATLDKAALRCRSPEQWERDPE